MNFALKKSARCEDGGMAVNVDGSKIAIVADEAGTTRDISEFEYTDESNDLSYILADSS